MFRKKNGKDRYGMDKGVIWERSNDTDGEENFWEEENFEEKPYLYHGDSSYHSDINWNQNDDKESIYYMERSVPYRKSKRKLLYGAFCFSSLMALVLLTVLLWSHSVSKTTTTRVTDNNRLASAEESATRQGEISKEVAGLVRDSTLTSDDLDIWDTFGEDEFGRMKQPAQVPVEETTEETEAATEAETTGETTEGESTEESEEETQEKHPLDDGNHTKITNAAGEEEWVEIAPYLKKNTYDYEGLVYKEPVMKYYEGSENISYLGIDVSKNDGVVNFAKCKKAGVDYAMIKLGGRGYNTGKIMADDAFETNIKEAGEAGLLIGITFSSQAVTIQEALDEAVYIITELKKQEENGIKIQYPVAIDMLPIANDSARTDTLTRDARTDVAKTILSTLRDYGYKPMLYGTKSWLIQNVKLVELTSYDIWLSQEEDVPDYPYQFTMWQYTKGGELNGIKGEAHLNISFVDFTTK